MYVYFFGNILNWCSLCFSSKMRMVLICSIIQLRKKLLCTTCIFPYWAHLILPAMFTDTLSNILFIWLKFLTIKKNADSVIYDCTSIDLPLTWNNFQIPAKVALAVSNAFCSSGAFNGILKQLEALFKNCHLVYIIVIKDT